MTLVSLERAILFADVSGSTALYEKLGDKLAAKMIDTLLDELREPVAKHRGTVVKTIGDELMVAFDRPNEACRAAMEMQQRVTARPPDSGVKLAIRIGFHYGPVLEDKGDFLGDGVNTAARLAEIAKAGQILTSEAAVNALPTVLRLSLRDLDVLPLKGKQEAMRVFEVMWGDTDDATLVARVSRTPAVARLTLRIGERDVEFPKDKAFLMLGRDATCDIAVEERTASRLHARIERSGAQYILIDESTNGTYVEIEGESEVLLRREPVMLRGRGKIALGTSLAEAAELILFSCS
jgi:adenylate cyclase